jgi:signal peptidase I
MGTWLKIVAWVAAIVGAIALVLDILFFEPWKVPTDDPLAAASTEPTLSAGDLVVVTRHGSVSRGELLRCADPDAPGRYVVARVLGLEGEQVRIEGEMVFLDNKRDPSPRACAPQMVTVHDPRTDDDVVLTCGIEEVGDMPYSVLRVSDHPELPTKALVEPGRCFLVSDNRHIHLDSRDFGQIDPNTCQHVVYRLVGAAGFGDSKRRLSLLW